MEFGVHSWERSIMVEDKAEPREIQWRQLLPWVDLFQGFRVALDLNKLLLAAAGILVMAGGWWFLAVLFNSTQKPKWNEGDFSIAVIKEGNEEERTNTQWARFRPARDRWNLLHETAGSTDDMEPIEPGDLAESPPEYDELEKEYAKLQKKVHGTTADIAAIDRDFRDHKISEKEAKLKKLGLPKPAGRLRTLPWHEDRGPNPYLMVTGQAGRQWETGHFWDWLLTEQVPVMIEPLIKFFLPVRYFFKSDAGPYNKFYFLLVMIWTLLTWSFFGGAITRIAAVQLTRQEKIGLKEALRFTWKRFLSYLTAPLFPMGFMLVLFLLMIIFGFLHWIPVLGDLLDGLLWWAMVVLGLVMAILLVGLVSWPLMAAAVSTEGTDSWEAVSRSYSYLISAPWHFIWYNLVAIAYGAVLIFFIGFIGSLMVFLAKWGVSQTPGLSLNDREPEFLFVYAPTSFGWRELLLQGAHVHKPGPHNVPAGTAVVKDGRIDENALDDFKHEGPNQNWNINCYFSAWVVSVVWIGLIFLVVIGFGYSYFWTASTIIYLLMRRKVDDAEMDEVYLEEDDQDLTYTPPATTTAPPPPPGGPSTTMVEPPSLRTPPSQASPTIPMPPEAPAHSGASLGESPAAPPKTESSPGPSGNGGPSGDGPGL
jgi:hypothetical protein